jgi:hypothetical protein
VGSTVQKTVNVGVNALAKEIGLSPSTVSIKLKRGMTVEQVRRDAANKHARDHRRGMVKAMAEGKIRLPGSNSVVSGVSGGYKPSRTLPTTAPVNHRASLISQPSSQSAPPPIPPKRTVDPEFNAGDEDFDYEDAIRAHKEDEGINAARLRRAIALADEKELQNAQKLGELIPVVQVRNWGTKCLVAFRDKLMQAASEMQDELAAETRPGKVRDKLEKRFRAVLEEVQGLKELWGVQTEKEEKAAAV